MKSEFQNYEKWLPYNSLANKYGQGYSEQRVSNIMDKLRAKSAHH